MKNVRRLYSQFKPENYLISIDPDKTKLVFKGQVTIQGQKTGRPSKRITLHAKDLQIDHVSLTSHDQKGDTNLTVKRTLIHKSYDELRIHTDQLMMPGKYTVKVKFQGKITKPMNGIYPCFFTIDGQEQTILATQFESHYAREAFPCIDEPEAKAIFQLTLTSEPGDCVLSNTPVKHQTENNGRLISEFEPTPKMSSYLLAFVSGNLNYREGRTKNGVLVRSYATPNNANYLDFAQQSAIASLNFYNDYFNIDYPLTKCDLVALPDFASGAMENWGLITFREQAMLVDPDNTSLWMKQYVANVIAHELTHQWFGNLVTMRWWNDLWLNESFATLMSYLAVDAQFPDWKVWTQFIIDEQLPALALDGLANTHPINVKINHPDEIHTIFDMISYEKGASVLYMLMHYLGDNAFRDGLRIYLKRHAYSNTESNDLWHAWEEAAKQPIAAFMDSWTKQAGFPLLQANIATRKVQISQERFYINPEANKTPTVWPVPLFNGALNGKLLESAETSIPIHETITLINKGRKAFCRIVYDQNSLNNLSEQFSQHQLDPLDRQGILSDYVEAAKAGYRPITDALNLVNANRQEDNLIVWDVIASLFGSINTLMDSDEIRQLIYPWMRELANRQYRRLGWQSQPQEQHFDTLLRPLILGLMLTSEDENALKQARKLYSQSTQHPINPDLRGIIYTSIARHGGQQEFNELLTMHNRSTNSEERILLCAALTNFRQDDIIQQALGKIRSDDVRLQDVGYWIGHSFANRFARHQAWAWFKDNWEWLKANLGSDMMFAHMPIYVVQSCSDKSFITEFTDFYKPRIDDSLVRSFNQALETLTWHADWKERDYTKILNYFQNISAASTSSD